MIPPRTFSFGVPWEDAFGYSQAVLSGDTLHVSGQLSHDAEGNFIGEGDFAAQVRASHANLDRVLEAFGMNRDHVIETEAYLVDIRRDFPVLAELNRAYFGAHRPAATVSGVSGLALPAQLVEIRAVARRT